jgi:hypothetical protein
MHDVPMHFKLIRGNDPVSISSVFINREDFYPCRASCYVSFGTVYPFVKPQAPMNYFPAVK